MWDAKPCLVVVRVLSAPAEEETANPTDDGRAGHEARAISKTG